MFGFGKKRSNAKIAGDWIAKAPEGKRCYAIGDVHGCLDLLTDLIEKIREDDAQKPEKETFVVFLGDLIDRGPDSKGVLDYLIHSPPDFAKNVFLTGNHEIALLNGLKGDNKLLQTWLNQGGIQCALSYGVPANQLLGAEPDHIQSVLMQAIPQKHIAFLESLKTSARFGDYFLVHAGVRPGVSLSDQRTEDFFWIRDEFLSSDFDFGVKVIHGHSVSEEVQEKQNRIGVDTGAYNTGILTAICLEDESKSYLQARQV